MKGRITYRRNGWNCRIQDRRLGQPTGPGRGRSDGDNDPFGHEAGVT